MNNNTLTRKEFYLLIGWIIVVVVVALIERYNLDGKVVLNKLEVKDFKQRKIEIRGRIVERNRINLELSKKEPEATNTFNSK